MNTFLIWTIDTETRWHGSGDCRQQWVGCAEPEPDTVLYRICEFVKRGRKQELVYRLYGPLPESNSEVFESYGEAVKAAETYAKHYLFMASGMASYVMSLLEAQIALTDWSDDLARVGAELHHPVIENWGLLDLALDMMGEPMDNTHELTEAQRTGEEGWPDHVHCRDYIHELFWMMVGRHRDYEVFIRFVRARHLFSKYEDMDVSEIEANLYPPNPENN